MALAQISDVKPSAVFSLVVAMSLLVPIALTALCAWGVGLLFRRYRITITITRKDER